MAFPTFYTSPDSISARFFEKAAGVKGFKAVVEAAGGEYLSGRRFRGDDLTAKAVAAYGFYVAVYEGPGGADFNAAYHRRSGKTVPWVATRPHNLPIVG